jgi:two-component system phosphate regulon sensor histidine kinase PhoR
MVHFRDETDSLRAERSRVDFLANASHELRTPLASLSGFIETLRGHAKDDPEARDQFLRIMTVQAERMSRLIDDLMSLSRIELNEHIPPSGSCDLALAVMDVVDALRLMTAAKGVSLDLKLPERGAAEVAGDRHQIVQVAQNLLDNALKYSSAGGSVRVEVITGLTAAAALAASSAAFTASAGASRLSLLTPDRSRDEARYVILRITDSGPGMSREHLPRLAERFYRVEGQKSGERLGTGLGLAIVKHVMNRHRGGLIVESAPGVGSAFTAYFPTSMV